MKTIILLILLIIAVSAQNLDDITEIVRREEAFRICSGMFGAMDSEFGRAINTRNSTSIKFRVSRDNIERNYIVADFAYRLIEDQTDGTIRERYVKGLSEVFQLLARFADQNYKYRPTLPIVPRLKSYSVNGNLRTLTLETDVFHFYIPKDEPDASFIDNGINNIVCKEQKPGEFKFIQAVLHKEYIYKIGEF